VSKQQQIRAVKTVGTLNSYVWKNIDKNSGPIRDLELIPGINYK
jgi:hypothetical protein